MGPGHVALRQGRRSIAGQVYLVTFTTARRRRHFSQWTTAADACQTLTDGARWPHSRLLAWVLMPDHWHGLVELGGWDTLPICVGRLKGRTARALRQGHPELGRVWATAYQDRAMRDERDTVRAARYLVMNPVRAGLVRRVGDYPFWDAVWL